LKANGEQTMRNSIDSIVSGDETWSLDIEVFKVMAASPVFELLKASCS